MANRAYLYSADSINLEDWQAYPPCNNYDSYWDSRWNIPLAWLFFFRPQDVVSVRIYDEDKRDEEAEFWQPFLFVAMRSEAIITFENNTPLLLSILSDKPSSADNVRELKNSVAVWSGKYLVLYPLEVIEDYSNEARAFYRQFLEGLGHQHVSARDIAKAYGGSVEDAIPFPRIPYKSPDFNVAVFGVGYT